MSDDDYCAACSSHGASEHDPRCIKWGDQAWSRIAELEAEIAELKANGEPTYSDGFTAGYAAASDEIERLTKVIADRRAIPDAVIYEGGWPPQHQGHEIRRRMKEVSGG